MSIRSLKLCFNGEIRRFSLESLKVVEGKVSLEDLKTVVRTTFSELENKEFNLCYKDEDDDVITISTDDEIGEAFNVVKDLSSNVLRLEVTVLKETEKQVSKGVHFRIICDGCGANPILGDRFKCSVRDDFDLCSKCEALDNSPYAYLKIKTPAQSPAAIMTILKPHQHVEENFAQKVAQTETKFNDEVIATPKPTKQAAVEKVVEKIVAGCPIPSLVRLECLSALREFGPFYAMRKTNGTLVFLNPNNQGDYTKMDKPWKSGKCLRLVKGGAVEMDGNGGPWASFHIEPVIDASGGGGGDGPNNVVRIICANRRLCLSASNGQLSCVDGAERGLNTQFKFHEASSMDQQVDPVWDAAAIQEDKIGIWDDIPQSPPAAAAAEEESPFWEGMSASLIEDVKAQMALQQPAAAPAAEVTVTPQASFVRDVTIPDGQVVETGEKFVKTWRFRNDSDFAFPKGVKLVRAGGAVMGQVSEVYLDQERTIHPFEEFEVSVEMTAPDTVGKYASFWRLETIGSEKFGHQVWIEVTVIDTAAACLKLKAEEDELNHQLLEAAMQQADNFILEKLKTEQDEAETRMLQEAACAQAEETLAIEAAQKEALEASRLETLRLEEVARAQDELALAEAQEVAQRLASEEAAAIEAAERLEAEMAALARIEAERVQAEAAHELELEALVQAEEVRIEALVQAEEVRIALEIENAKADVEEEGNGIDWEHVEVLNEEGSQASEQVEEGSVGSSDLYASDLSASVEGAQMAGAALGDLSESVVAVIGAHSFGESMDKWGGAVTRLFEMGFDDVPSIVAACEKHATPENYESKLQVIVDEMLTNMPSA